MLRRYGFVFIIAFFVIALTSFYIYLKKQQSPQSTAIHAIPVNAGIVVEINSPFSFIDAATQKNKIWEGLLPIKEFAQFNEQLILIDSLLENTNLKQAFKTQNLLVSIHEIGNKNFSELYLVKLDNRIEGNQLIKQIDNLLVGKGKIQIKKYNQTKVFGFKPTNSKSGGFYYSFVNGILMASVSEMLIQDAIRQTDSDTGLESLPGFKRLHDTKGAYADANLFIQDKYFKKQLEKLVKPEFLNSCNLNNYADWTELDLNLKTETLQLNGFSTIGNDQGEFLSLFKNQEPQSLRFTKFVPAGLEGFAAFGISDIEAYSQSLLRYMEETGQRERLDVNQKQLRDNFGSQTMSRFKSIFNGELAQIALADGSKLFMVKTSGYNDATELLNELFTYHSATFNVEKSKLYKNYKVDDESVFRIYTMPLNKFPARFFGPWFSSSKANYVTVFDNYLVFGDTYQNLTRFIYNNILQKTLYYDVDFKRYANFMTNKVNAYLYQSLKSKGVYFDNFLTERAVNDYSLNQETISNFYGLGWQFTNENGLFFNNLTLHYQPTNKLNAATEWETRLDTLIAFKPALVLNHYTKEKEIFVQDLNNTIYLINRLGRVLWKKKLSEPIMGTVHQVDVFRNGKLQLLFNTKSKLYCVDRNGNFVDRYPINLPSPAAVECAVFDYDKRKNYRIFVPGSDKKVYVFNVNGNRVTGFNFKGTDHAVIAPIQHFRDNNKDYIAVTDEARIYLLDRKGNSRVKLKQQFTPSVNNTFIYQKASSQRPSRLIRTDIKGNVYFVYFNGNVEQKQIRESSEDHFFSFQDITGDRVSDFVFVDENRFEVFNLAGKRLFGHKFKTNINHSPSLYKFSANKLALGITEETERKIYLFDKKGEIMEGFPLPGKTKFSIGFLEPGSTRFNLLVGGDEQYLYNYKLN